MVPVSYTHLDVYKRQGVFAHVAVQVVLNIAVVTNFIPNTGVSLPFISYGGTASFFLLLEMGIVLNISSKIRLER